MVFILYKGRDQDSYTLLNPWPSSCVELVVSFRLERDDEKVIFEISERHCIANTLDLHEVLVQISIVRRLDRIVPRQEAPNLWR